MKRILHRLVGLALLFWSIPALALGVSSKFNYNGSLRTGQGQVSGFYDFCFTLYPSGEGGSQTAPPMTNMAVVISNGVFVTQVDFGTNVFDGNAYWLEVGVRTNGTTNFTMLSPRQELTATPYASYAPHSGKAQSVASNAITAESIQDATLTAAKFATGAVLQSLNGLKDNVTLTAGTNITLSTLGSSIQVSANVNFSSIDSTGSIRSSDTVLLALIASMGVSYSPLGVAAADVNGDGRVDLIVVHSPSKVSVLINNGSGGFVLGSSSTVGFSPQCVITADVNGDGRVDVITANAGAHTLSVLTNNGVGGFALSSSPPVGLVPYWVAAADVNGDGRTDLISANGGTNTLSVVTNSGNGAFALAGSLTVGGNSPQFVVAADLNGDGRPDLVSANSASNTLSMLTNNGSGWFVLASNLVVGAGPRFIVAADINGDGWADLVSANSSFNTLSVLTNDGGGGFALASSPTMGSNPFSVAAADINGDGRPDLIAATPNINAVSVFTNAGNSTFALLASLPVKGSPRFVLAAEINGDSAPELIVSQLSLDTVSVLGKLPPVLFYGNFDGRFFGDGRGLSGVALLDGTNRFDGFIGIGRSPLGNALEVEGNASKTVAGSWLANSDARIKTRVHTITNALEKLAAVRLVQFHYSEDYRAAHPGIADHEYPNVIAQEFQKVFPDEVKSSGEKLPNGDTILQVDTYPLTIYSAAAVQELNAKLKSKDTEIQQLKQRLERLEEIIQKQLDQKTQ